jgi:hypothetical protein
VRVNNQSSKTIDEIQYLPINIYTIETEILHKGNGGRSKLLSSSLGAQWSSKIARVCPASDRHKNLQVSVLFLEQEELFDAAIYIGAHIVPRVGGVVFVSISVGV